MNAKEIRDRILEISHDEVMPEAELRHKGMSWLNSAYQEMVGVCMPYLESYITKTEMIEFVDGKADAPHDFYRILNVGMCGLPMKNMYNEGKILIHKSLNGSCEVTYLGQIQDLTEGTKEEDILLPKQFHHGLVWGGLVWSSIFERGFGTSNSDLKLFQAKWDESKRECKLHLCSNTKASVKELNNDN